MPVVSVCYAISSARVAVREQQKPPKDREGPCTAQQHLHDLVFGEGEVGTQLSAPPHPMRDSSFRTSRTLLYGGRDSCCAYRSAQFSGPPFHQHQLQGHRALGVVVLRTAHTCTGAVVCVNDKPSEDVDACLHLLVPSAHMALLEQEFLSSETLCDFEEAWAGPSIDHRRMLVGAHQALSQFMRGLAAHELPFGLFAREHHLDIEGVVPWLSLYTPETQKEMRAAATALRLSIAYFGIGVSSDMDTDSTAEVLPRILEKMKTQRCKVRLSSTFVQLASNSVGLMANMNGVDTETIEDMLLRSVCGYLGMIVALRDDLFTITGGESAEMRASLVVQERVELTEATRRQITSKMHTIVAEENRQRLTLASTAARCVLNPITSPMLEEILSLLPRVSFLQGLLDLEQLDELPSALAVFFERGFASSELLRTKYRSNVTEYLQVVGGMLCSRSAIALLVCDAADRPTDIKIFWTSGEVVLRPCDLPRLVFAPWALVLVLNKAGVGVVRTNGVEKEMLAFSSKARRELARICPDMAPLAERLLAELRSTRERVDALLSPEGAPARKEFARLADEGPVVKKLRTSIGFFSQMAAC